MSHRQRPHEPPLIRRDAEGNERTAPSWETLTERLIREAQADGAFDDLPRRGEPLQLDDDHYAGEMAMANHLLRNAGVAPPWIEADKEVRQRREAIEALLERAQRAPVTARGRLEDDLTRLAEAHDEAVARLDGLAPTTRLQRSRLDRELLRRRLRRALSDGRAAT